MRVDRRTELNGCTVAGQVFRQRTLRGAEAASVDRSIADVSVRHDACSSASRREDKIMNRATTISLLAAALLLALAAPSYAWRGRGGGVFIVGPGWWGR